MFRSSGCATRRPANQKRCSGRPATLGLHGAAPVARSVLHQKHSPSCRHCIIDGCICAPAPLRLRRPCARRGASTRRSRSMADRGRSSSAAVWSSSLSSTLTSSTGWHPFCTGFPRLTTCASSGLGRRGTEDGRSPDGRRGSTWRARSTGPAGGRPSGSSTGSITSSVVSPGRLRSAAVTPGPAPLLDGHDERIGVEVAAYQPIVRAIETV